MPMGKGACERMANGNPHGRVCTRLIDSSKDEERQLNLGLNGFEHDRDARWC
jgi:hypothetical protein